MAQLDFPKSKEAPQNVHCFRTGSATAFQSPVGAPPFVQSLDCTQGHIRPGVRAHNGLRPAVWKRTRSSSWRDGAGPRSNATSLRHAAASRPNGPGSCSRAHRESRALSRFSAARPPAS
eukprot:10552597-Heterocapsa_arctica.AAC.2